MMICREGRLDRRQQAFVEAARAVFVEMGYERTTLAHVVDRAGGSLATLYKLFGNKEGLLWAVLLGSAESGELLVLNIGDRASSPAAAMREIGLRLHEKFLDPDKMAMFRIVIARSLDDASFAQHFYEETMQRTCRALETLFARWQDEGAKLTASPGELATIFLGLIVYDFQVAAISHIKVRAKDEGEIRRRVDFFLSGAGLSDSGGQTDGASVTRTE